MNWPCSDKLWMLIAATLRQVIREWSCNCGTSCFASAGAQNARFNLTNNLPHGSSLLGGKAKLAGKAPFEFCSFLNLLQAKLALALTFAQKQKGRGETQEHHWWCFESTSRASSRDYNKKKPTQWKTSSFFWCLQVFVSFSGETRGHSRWHIGAANVDQHKWREIYICWELLSLCRRFKLETLGHLQAKYPFPPAKRGKDELRKKLHMDLAAPQQPASVLLQGKERRDKAGLEILFCLHWGNKRELLCYSLVITVALLPRVFLKQALCKGSNLVMVNH